MSNLVFNPQSKDYFQAKACVAISMRYNYAGSYRSYRFKFLSFCNWSSSYCAAFCFLLSSLEKAACKSDFSLSSSDIYELFLSTHILENYQYFYRFLGCMTNVPLYSVTSPASVKLSIVYKTLEVLIKYNLGEVRYDLVSPMFEQKSAIRYAAYKYFPDTPFIDIESDFLFKNVMD